MAEYNFCGSEFWNMTKLWSNSNPDFTTCFEQTALVWGPCVFLWIFCLLELWYLKHSTTKYIPWSFQNISKLVLITSLIVLSVIDIVMAWRYNGSDYTTEIYTVNFVTPAVKLLTFILAGLLTYGNKIQGQQTSGLLFLFWILLSICAIPQMRTEAHNFTERSQQEEVATDDWIYYQLVSFIVFFSVSWLITLISCFADAAPIEYIYGRQKNPNRELSASFLSRITFSYFDRMAWMGYKKPLETSDMWDLKYGDSSKEVTPLFQKHWSKSLEKAGRVTYADLGEYNLYDQKTPLQTSQNKLNKPSTKNKKKEASVVPAICKSFGATFVFGSIIKVLYDLMIFVNPQLLDKIISFAKSEDPLWKGIFFAVSLFAVASLNTLLVGQHYTRMFYVGMRIRTALVSAIYRKSLVLSNSARKERTVGEIVNLMAVDAQRFIELLSYLSLLWSAPLQIGLSLYFLWQILGPSTLVGLATMIALIPLNAVIATKTKTLQIKQMKYKDRRVKLMNEILNGMKVLKLYAWEPSFEKRVLDVRDDEIKALRTAAYLNAGFSFIWTCAPYLISLSTFATYVLISPDNVLDAQKAFVSLSLFNIMRTPFTMLPMLVTSLVQTIVSVKRINKFMNSDEIVPSVDHDPAEKAPLVIENGSFCWEEGETTLRDINMRVNDKELVAVVGAVGCGKSSLVSVFLGDMEKISGRVNLLGSVAYVAQQAWIQNATLKENILFGKPFDQKKYDRVIEACALRSDLDMLPGGDQTEIGEKGINLSGGQKQRVSLARAVYQDADVYFLDDPLSAVDSHVGKHIFEQVIGPGGLLAKKTRLLVTHSITFLPQVDNIFVMTNGEISESGTYKELLAKKGAFADFLIEHVTKSAEEVEDLDEFAKEIEVEDMELRAKLQRAISTVSARRESVASRSSGGSPRHSRLSLKASNGDLRRRKSTLTEVTPVEPPKKGEKLIEAEKAETGKVKWDVYKYYLKNIGYGIGIATLIMQILFQTCSVGSNLWLSQWSTDTRANEPYWRNIYLGGYGAFGLAQAIFTMIGALIFKTGAVAAAALIHAWLLNNIVRCPMAFFDTTPLGRILARFSSDVQAVDQAIPMIIEFLFMMGLGVISTITVICISTPWFMTVIVPIAIVYYFVQRFYIATSRQLKRLESVTRSPIYSNFSETLTGVSTIRAYGVESRFIETSDTRVDKNQVCYFPSIIANRWLTTRLEMVGNLIVLFAAFFAVLGRDSENALNAGLVGLSVSYAMQVTQTLNWLVRLASDIETNIVAVERIKEYGETTQEAAWNKDNETTPPDWPVEGTTTFENYQVRYREGLDLVLHGISFEVKGGEKVGIVGRTGAGKSSMTLGLFRIIEAAGGKILIDGADISQMGLHTLRSRLTIIPQDPVLFSGTLRMNLDPFEKFSDNEIWTALENAHLKSFVKGLASGLNHEISEGGENLSVGQRQLVCLARALLRKTKVLILDEATAAVDLDTDDLIQNTIRTEFKECTVLTIAHRLNTIIDSDKVLVLDKGKIAEYAPPQELLNNKDSIFYGMAKDAGLTG